MKKNIFLLVAIVSLAACTNNRNPLEVRVENCPAAAIVAGTDQWIRFAGTGRGANDLQFEASISNVRIECRQSDDVTTDVRFDLTVTGGPALAASEPVRLTYFVALLRDNARIMAKQTYVTEFVISPETPSAGSTEVIRQYIPEIENARLYDYELVIGFQLSPDDVVYNLAR